MIWDRPAMLLGLWVLPLLGWVIYRANASRRKAAREFADDHLFRRLAPGARNQQAWFKLIFAMLALGCLIVATARPKYGEYDEEVKQSGVDMFILLDVSRSMLADDVKPNRLERAKSDIKDLLAKLPGDRVGLIAFAGSPSVKVPLTLDHEYLKSVLDSMTPDSAPMGGSLIGDAIRRGLTVMKEQRERDQILLLITDGEDQESLPMEAAKLAKERGVRIFAVGLGDPVNGSKIPGRSRQGQRYMTENGKEVWSRMDETLLRDLAVATNGAYIPAKTTAYDLGQLYEDHLGGLNRGEMKAGVRRRHYDRFQWFIALGLAFLALHFLVDRATGKSDFHPGTGTQR